MTRAADDPEETRTDSDEGTLTARPVPVLVVVGDARTLGSSRAVFRIQGLLEIGRQPDAAAERAWVVEDDRVSRRHALLRIDPLRPIAELRDLGSRNGTMVNGRPLGEAAVQLAPGSLIFVGTYAAIFRFAQESDLQAIADERTSPFTPVPTTCPDLARRTQMLRHLARGQDDFLLLGETGVGKEEFARGLHQASRRSGRFVPINCPALPHSLIESELFGYVKGAHSQAARDKAGLIDAAEGGTLFLDEFAEIPTEVQAKLLRFLETKQLQPLGSTRTQRADVRVVAATNRELSALRQDIVARLGPEPIRLPPLRHHKEDIAALGSHFLRERPGISLEVSAFQTLCLQDWPDNIRALRKTLTRAADLAMAEGTRVIALKHLPESFAAGAAQNAGEPAVVPPPTSSGRRGPRAALSKEELEALLDRHEWVVSRAAREIDRDHAVLWRWIRRYGLNIDRTRE
jgi:transcriptional regulator with GAF, ATPase, and Fis domain